MCSWRTTDADIDSLLADVLTLHPFPSKKIPLIP
jgi:hypothetical protein